jgi:hypothetical protein
VKEAGTVYVLLETDRTRHTGDRPNDRSTDTPPGLVGQMQARIDSLERQLEQANERDRENRRIIAALTSRIPAIEAPHEATGGAEPVEEEAEPRPATGGAQEGLQRPWWRRVFGR